LSTSRKKQTQIKKLRDDLKGSILEHTRSLGLVDDIASGGHAADKQRIRSAHKPQALERAKSEETLIERHGSRLLGMFAEGSDIAPECISPKLIPVGAGTDESRLFRLATLLWSVPVSTGFGRRMRFLIMDEHNGKLLGVLGLCSPVFNLKVRDAWIGWDAEARRQRLIHMMDAFVLGAIPPYSQLLCGKLVGALVASAEVSECFRERYRDRKGTISGMRSSAELSLVTTTSALGRSSIYNRLVLPGLVSFERLGWTEGWGHFQVPKQVFSDMRKLLELCDHSYANGNRYGDGPNWRMRVIRVALQNLGLDPHILRHGIRREVFGVPIAANWKPFLLGEASSPLLDCASSNTIADACLRRWVIPRAHRNTEYLSWTLEDTWHCLIGPASLSSP